MLVGVYVSEQLLLLPTGEPSVQAPPPLKVPVPEVVKVTLPVGADAPAPALSDTVAVQVLA